jgi:hypothetical protein
MKFNIGDVIKEGINIWTIAIITDIKNETYIVQALEIFIDIPRRHRINLAKFEMDEKAADEFELLDDKQNILKLLFQREIFGHW